MAKAGYFLKQAKKLILTELGVWLVALLLPFSSAGRRRLGRKLMSLRDSHTRQQLGQDLQKPRALAAVAILVFGVVLQTIITQPVFATSVTNFPTATGTNSWTTPANAEAADTNNATAAPGKNATVNGIWKTFGFGSIPSTATINSVVVNVNYKISASNTVTQLNVTALEAGVACGTAQSDTSRPLSMTVVTFDVTACRSWAVADLNDTNFSVQVGAQKGNSNTTFTFSMDYVSVTVGYTIPITFTQASYRVFNNQDAANPATTFVSTWGGTGTDDAYAVVQTSDGGYAVAGTTTSFGDTAGDAYIAKFNSSGQISWAKSWGGAGFQETVTSMIQTSDGGYALTGGTQIGDGLTYDAMLVKFDSSGTMSWNKTWGSSSTAGDVAQQVIQTSDGGYAIAGEDAAGDAFIAKYTSTGTLSFSQKWGGTGTDQANGLVQTSDGGYALTGQTFSFSDTSNGDMFLTKLTSAGAISWSKSWGSATKADSGNSVVQTSDGGFAVTGFTASYGDTTNGDAFLAKYDSTGTLSWSKTWGGTSRDEGKWLVQTSDGGYAVTGQANSFGPNTSGDMFLAKYDSSGTLSWNMNFGGTGKDTGQSIDQTSDGGYAIAGITFSYNDTVRGDPFLAKTDGSGGISSCSTACGNPSATVTAPTATTGTPAASGGAITPVTSTPSVTSGTPAMSASYAVALTLSSIDVGSALAAQNTAATVPGDGQPFRVRLDIGVSASNLSASGQNFKLQYASNGSTACTTAPTSWTDVTDTTNVQYYDNPVASNSTVESSSTTNDVTDGANAIVHESYQEKGTTTFSNPTAINSGQDGMWDFALTMYQSLQNTHYCLRMVASDGTPLNAYTVYPDLVTQAATYRQGAYRWFKNSGGTAFTQTSSNPATSADAIARAVQYDSNGNMYTAGFCGGQNDWCAEKRSSSTGALSYTVNESGFTNGGQGVFGLAIDQANDAMFLVGYDSNPGSSNQEWRIEKRTMSTGALVSGFGTGGIITENISANGEEATGIAIDAPNGFIYVIGYDSSGTTGKWRLEKRATSTGALSYGVSETISANSDSPLAIKLDTAGGFAYIVGYDQLNSVPTQNEWRIEKRTLSTGALVSGFGTSGGISESISTGVDQAYDLALDTTNGFLYVVGSDNNAGSAFEWRMEKRSTSTGGLVSGFGTGGAISEHISFSSDEAYTAQVEPSGGYLYVGGYDESPSGSLQEWRLEKRSTSTGGLVSGFGTGGAVVEHISSSNDALYASAIDVANGALYLVGFDTSSGIWDGWRTEKRNTSDGSFFNGINMSPLTGLNQALDLTTLATPLHLKIDLGPIGSGVAASGQTFKLQYANKTTTCAAATYSDVTAATSIQWYDDTSITGGSTVTSNANDPVDGTNTNVYETNQEANTFSNASQIFVGQDGLWDFSLMLPTGLRPGTDICLRLTDGSGNPISTYSVYPEIQFGPQMKQLMRNEKWFDSNGTLQPYFLGIF